MTSSTLKGRMSRKRMSVRGRAAGAEEEEERGLACRWTKNGGWQRTEQRSNLLWF